MNVHAYLVAFIDKATKTVVRAGVFSEERPTCSFGQMPVVLCSVGDRDYADAAESLRERLCWPSWQWLRPALDPDPTAGVAQHVPR